MNWDGLADRIIHCDDGSAPYANILWQCSTQMGGCDKCANKKKCIAFWNTFCERMPPPIPLDEFRAKLTELRKELVKVNG